MPLEPPQRFQAESLRRFLTSVDGHLVRPAELVVIGGSACALGYGVSLGTIDVDTYNTIDEPLQSALLRARTETALSIPVERSTVADLPINFEARLQRAMPELRLLRVMVLERHDLALSKTLRGNRHDLDAIEELHGVNPLDQAILVERYVSELGAAIGDPRRLDGNLVLLVHCLFGEIDADRVRRRLAEWRRRAR